MVFGSRISPEPPDGICMIAVCIMDGACRIGSCLPQCDTICCFVQCNVCQIGIAYSWQLDYIGTPSTILFADNIPDSKVHVTNMGPTWVLSVPDRPHVGPMNLAIRDGILKLGSDQPKQWLYQDCTKLKSPWGINFKINFRPDFHTIFMLSAKAQNVHLILSNTYIDLNDKKCITITWIRKLSFDDH